MKKLVSIMLVLGLIFSLAVPTLAREDGEDQDPVLAQADEVELDEVEMKEERTLPGDFLYPLKRLGETIRLAVSFNEQTRARLLSQYAERRLDELHTLVATGRDADEVVADLLEQFETLLDKLEAIDPDACLEEYGISAEKLEKITAKAEKKQALVARLAAKHLELSEAIEDRIEEVLENHVAIGSGLQRALQNATKRLERSQTRINERIQNRIQEMQDKGNDEGLQAMEQLHQRFQNKMESIKNKVNEQVNNRRGGNK